MNEFAPEYSKKEKVLLMLKHIAWAIPLILIAKLVFFGWINGFSWSPNGVDLIICAKRTQWEDMPANTIEYTWNHEVGHRFGMVAFGDKTAISGHNKLPDGPSTMHGENRGVNDKTHAGPHCEKGATFNSATEVWSGAPSCVMFGANGIGAAHAPKEYCPECAKIVRKLDLSV